MTRENCSFGLAGCGENLAGEGAVESVILLRFPWERRVSERRLFRLIELGPDPTLRAGVHLECSTRVGHKVVSTTSGPTHFFASMPSRTTCQSRASAIAPPGHQPDPLAQAVARFHRLSG